MRLTGPMVVIMWGVANAGLLLILRGYLGTGVELALYGGGLTITFLYGAVMVIARGRRSTTRAVFYVPRSALPAVFIAFGFALWALGLAFFPWPLVVGWVPVVIGVLLAWKDRREKPHFLPTEPPPITGSSVVPRGEVPDIAPYLLQSRPQPLFEPPPKPDETAVEALRTLAQQAGQPAKPLLTRTVAAAAGAAAIAAAAFGALRLGKGRAKQSVPLDTETVRRLLEFRVEANDRRRDGVPPH